MYGKTATTQPSAGKQLCDMLNISTVTVAKGAICIIPLRFRKAMSAMTGINARGYTR